jgi:hypothetical protein
VICNTNYGDVQPVNPTILTLNALRFSNLKQLSNYPNKAMNAKATAAALKPTAVAAPWNCTAGVVGTIGALLVVVALELDEMLAIAVVEVRGEELLEDD